MRLLALRVKICFLHGPGLSVATDYVSVYSPALQPGYHH